MNPRLLFVDDEPQILESLRNLLRKHRKRWDMTFALGGEGALAELDRQRFDVVVSDMRMPRVDGARVLAAVKDRQPAATRIILSGFSDMEAALRAVPVAQQFLSKPCDGEVLIAVIERVLRPCASPRRARVLEIVGGLHQLPSPPASFRDLELVVANLMSSTAEVSAVLADDPGMAAKVLQLANSAFFGLAHRAVGIDAAVGYLGLGTIRALVHASGAFVEVAPSGAARLEALQRRALHTAQVARALAGEGAACEAVAIALLSDIGQNVFEACCPDGRAAVDHRVGPGDTDRRATEEEVLGAEHAEVGAALLDIWGLPADVVNAVALHHEPPSDPRAEPMRAVIYVAAALAEGACRPGGPPCEPVSDVVATMGWGDEVTRLVREAERGAAG